MVGGEDWPNLLRILRQGGRYAIAGAIAGPIAEIDLRTLYLKDLTLYGCTFQEDEVFTNLISYVESGEIRPVVAKTYPLNEIHQAQEDFLSKAHMGKLVLIIPEVNQ
ncbi:putative NAD(P)H quinone oxidoreductase, PIG3 family [compost metagenome]